MAAWSDDVTLAATIVALATGVAAVWTGAKARWRKTLGSRRILAAQLNRLAAGTSLEYLTALLGVPAMRHNEENGLVVHIYATRHAWIEVRLEPRTGTVIGFAITVTDRKFDFSVETLTFGQFAYNLASPCSQRSPMMNGVVQTASGGASALGASSTLNTIIEVIQVAIKIMSLRSTS